LSSRRRLSLSLANTPITFLEGTLPDASSASDGGVMRPGRGAPGAPKPKNLTRFSSNSNRENYNEN
jgi:hypothetical protein